MMGSIVAVGAGWSLPAAAFSYLAAALVAMPVHAAQEGPGPEHASPPANLVETVEARLREAEGVDASRIRVEMDGDLLALNGTVPHLLARDRAIHIATSVKGVRAIDDNLVVEPVERPDHEIERDVETALALNPATEHWDINAIVNGGSVTLEGVVESFAELSLAETVTKGVRGVRAIQNNIQVDFNRDRPDAEIAHDVVEALRWNTEVDSDSVKVEVEDGVVRLSGTVDTLFEKEEAERLARFAGAQEVDVRSLRVEPDPGEPESRWADPGDEDIAAALRLALASDPRVDTEPEVTVEDGIVTLTGTVGSEDARRAAEETARRTWGVAEVRNQLSVQPPAVPDDELARRVTAALRRDPYVSGADIEVEAADGRVFLYGEVDSWFDKAEAGAVASRIAGVREVRNELDVPVLRDVSG